MGTFTTDTVTSCCGCCYCYRFACIDETQLYIAIVDCYSFACIDGNTVSYTFLLLAVIVLNVLMETV